MLALLLVLTTVASIGVVALAGDPAEAEVPRYKSTYNKVDISDITGEIAEPPQLTSAASSVAREKEWYEYVYYSPEPVGYFYLTEGTRIAFYDPYDYADALIMEVDDSITDWSSMNTLQVSYTTGNSVTDTSGKSSETSTSVQLGYTDTEITEKSKSVVTNTVETKTETYNTSKEKTEIDNSNTWSIKESKSLEGNVVSSLASLIPGVGTVIAEVLDCINSGTERTYNNGIGWNTKTVEGDKTGVDGGTRTGYTVSENTTTTTTGPTSTKVENIIADRVTKAVGNSVTTSVALTSNNSTTVSKTYDASHFNANGSPLQWKVIKYTVQMPMKYQVEYQVDDEWVFGDTSYCLLTTIQGTTRSWLQNNVAYYEHWGTGEAVTWDEFWNQFFTPEKLIQAYQTRLYPDN